LSAFLQPSLLIGVQGASNTGGLTAQYAQYLNACVLGSATYSVSDLVMRLETIVYPDESYEFVKSVRANPIPYMSLRQQIDPLPIASSGTFSQRIAINNPIVLGFCVFFVPTNNNKATYLPLSGAVTTPLA
jgi:hypothetical protein